MANNEPKQLQINKQTLIPLSMVAAIVLGAMWVSNAQQDVEIQLLTMSNRIENLEKTMGEISTVMSDGVLEKDFDRWARALAVSNPELEVPEPPD